MEQVIRKRHSGMFKPGQSGNPLGRPKTDKTVQALAREQTETAIRTLTEIANNPRATDSARVQACNALLDRAWGRPVQTNQNLNVGTSYVDFLEELGRKDEAEGNALFA